MKCPKLKRSCWNGGNDALACPTACTGVGSAAPAAAVPEPGEATSISRKGRWRGNICTFSKFSGQLAFWRGVPFKSPYSWLLARPKRLLTMQTHTFSCLKTEVATTFGVQSKLMLECFILVKYSHNPISYITRTKNYIEEIMSIKKREKCRFKASSMFNNDNSSLILL